MQGMFGRGISSSQFSTPSLALHSDAGMSSGSSGGLRMGVQGDSPWTGMKGLGSTGGLREERFKAPAIQVNTPTISMPKSSGGMRLGGGVGSSFGSGGGDLGKIY